MCYGSISANLRLDTYTELNKYARPWLPWNDCNTREKRKLVSLIFFIFDKQLFKHTHGYYYYYYHCRFIEYYVRL